MSAVPAVFAVLGRQVNNPFVQFEALRCQVAKLVSPKAGFDCDTLQDCSVKATQAIPPPTVDVFSQSSNSSIQTLKRSCSAAKPDSQDGSQRSRSTRRTLWRTEEITAWVRAGCPSRAVWVKMAQDQGFGHQYGQRF